jgi:hypothetical protein
MLRGTKFYDRSNVISLRIERKHRQLKQRKAERDKSRLIYANKNNRQRLPRRSHGTCQDGTIDQERVGTVQRNEELAIRCECPKYEDQGIAPFDREAAS